MPSISSGAMKGGGNSSIHNSTPTCTLFNNNNNTNNKKNPPPPPTHNSNYYQLNGGGQLIESKKNVDNNNNYYYNDDDNGNVIVVMRWKRWLMENASFMRWRSGDIMDVLRLHPIPCFLALCLLFFMGVEYTLLMVPHYSPPFDLGFALTTSIHRFLASSPSLNTLLAALNTVFVLMQSSYILWTWVIEGRPRATIATLFMFTFRGILGYSTQLPLPQEFLGSGADFPVGNVSFFLFYSGHVTASVIASLDMKRMLRGELSWAFDALNVLQFVRLLSTRGHYTIDLVVGVGAGILFDYIAGKYEEDKKLKKIQ